MLTNSLWRTTLLSWTLTLAACGSGGDDAPAPVPTTALLAPAAQVRELNHGATTDTLAGSFEVRFNGSQQPAWNAQADQAWLVLSPSVGTLRYTIDTAQLAAMPNWSDAVAQVRISATGLPETTTTLTLRKQLPEITMVWPNAVLAGQAGTVRLTGRGLSQLQGASGIQVQGVTGVTATVRSDGAATLSLPALPKGSYAISIPNTLGHTDTEASLAVVSDAAFTLPSVDPKGLSSFMIVDAERQVLFADLSRGRIDAGQWRWDDVMVPRHGATVSGGLWQAEAPDRTSVYGFADLELVAVDPDSLNVQAGYWLPLHWYPTRLHQALTSDLRLWFSAFDERISASSTSPTRLFLAYFDLRAKRFEKIENDITADEKLVFRASGDGSKLIGINRISGRRSVRYDAATGQFSAIEPLAVAGMLTDVSADGNLFVLDARRLYSLPESGQPQLLKTLDLPALDPLWSSAPTSGTPTEFFTRTVLSPNGQRAYALTSTRSDGWIDQVIAFDTAPGSSDTTAARLGTFDLPSPVRPCPRPVTGWEPFCANGALQITASSDTLIWPTNSALITIRIPDALRSLP